MLLLLRRVPVVLSISLVLNVELAYHQTYFSSAILVENILLRNRMHQSR